MLRRVSTTPIIPTNNGQPVLSEEELQRQAELEKDLQLARDLQQGMLLAAVPYLPGWEFSAVSIPARDLGGDLYDFLPLRNGKQAIMIGDVSGKGLQAALRMAVARTVFRHEVRLDGAPGRTLAAINRGVCTDIPQGMITMLYAVLDPAEGTFLVANAGHTYPLLFNETVQEFEMPGLPLGVDPDDDYDEECITIAPGDSLFLFTDGVNEAISPESEEFGYERLQALLENNSHMKPRAMMKLFLHELRAWSQGKMQTDDITMVILRRRFLLLSDELRVVALDVLGSEQATAFTAQIAESLPRPPEEMNHDDWNTLLPVINKVAKSNFSRGMARELSQQIRLTIEEYRPASSG
jgi:sigma-B regulation protein RsbU (phosphoserine phosphatase)